MKKTLLFVIAMTLTYGAPMTPTYTNDLIHEDSPYLQQHAHNPVHWMPWGDAAFAKAKKEHKLIFLSIGYSTCHWCHVMEHESFENPKLAKYLNAHFVPIKVDREERPQIDRYYQNVYQLMNRRGGGWPLTILMTADRKPFFSGTYIPLEPKYGSAGLWDVLKQIVEVAQKEPQKLEEVGDNVLSGMKQFDRADRGGRSVPIDTKLADTFVREVAARFDARNGGIGKQPKFPHASTITTLLQIHRLTGNAKALKMATAMLDHMAEGGIYDQIEGGFYRYSTDARWRIPHFEKMLYTNAELLEAYGIAYRLTGKPLYKKVITETAEVFGARYRKEGLYFSASDADSLDPATGHTEEGHYFVYTHKEALAALKKAGIDDAEKILDHFGISWEGNFEQGQSNPYLHTRITVDPAQAARALTVLRELRTHKPYPFIDHKLLSAWNGLMIHGLYAAAVADPALAATAHETMDALLKHLYIGGKLYHQVLPDKAPKVPALMEDYAFVILALLDTYEATQEVRYLGLARTLSDEAIRRFGAQGHWVDSDGDFASPASMEGNAYRAALPVMAENLMRLEILTDTPAYGAAAQTILEQGSPVIDRYPSSAPYGVLTALANQRGYIVLKAKPDRLPALRKALEAATSYPFILYRSAEDAMMLACRRDRCFAYDKAIEPLVKKVIENL